MRLHRLEVEGFGPFRARQSVDFDAFADDGIFLIAGRTGAGKSSILDAVCFGLYGGVPRYDGGEKRLRSDHSEGDDISEVVVEFSTPAGRFRVTRSPEYMRPAKRGGGLTKQAAAVALDEWTDAGWIGRAARAVDVAGELAEILQLSREQFLQVILLAQNRFSEFLLASSKDRQALLRRLFGTERFEDVQARFDERRRAAELALGARTATVGARLDEAERLVLHEQLQGQRGPEDDAADADGDASVGADGSAGAVGSADAAGGDFVAAEPALTAGDGTSTHDRLEALQRALARAEYRAERRVAERADAEARHARAEEILAARREERRAQTERDRARAALDRLEQQTVEITAARAELHAARAAESLRTVIAAAAKAEDAHAAAVEAEEQARDAWEAVATSDDLAALGEPDAGNGATSGEADLLEAWADRRTRETGAWEAAAELERRLPALMAQRDEAAVAVAGAEERIEAGTAAHAAAPAELTAATAARDEARRAADREADLRAARESASARLAAAHDVVRLATQLSEAERALVDAAGALATQQAALADLRRRRLDGFAGELASGLVDGAPCPVCGAVEHPAPADHSDPVSADDIDAAEATRDAAAEHERAVSERCAALRSDAAAANTRADGRDVETAETELEAARIAHAASETAAAAVASLDAEITRLTTRIEQLEVQRAVDEDAARAAREEHAVLLRRVADADEQVRAARGSYDTVADRLAETAGRIGAGRAVAAAVRERTRRREAAEDARAEREAALTASEFDDARAAERALRSASVQEGLQQRIDEHTAQLVKEKATLLELELLTLPEAAIDLEPSEQDARDARAAWIAAVDAATAAQSTARRLDDLITAAASEHAAVADDAAEFEVLRGLADTIAGRGANTHKMTLETFVLAAELEEIVTAANRRLYDMSTGRYQLRHSDALAARGAASGLGIVVHDAFTGQSRPAQSLSGGETFLSSLALALGLAEVVTSRAGGIRLDTLFIDEGFGSLDGDTLDVAMRTLDELRQGGRTVGVISHVEAMQEQIPAQLTVRATAEGPSVIETR